MLGAAVWGAGWVSGEHLKAYMANQNTEVVAIGDKSKEIAQAKADFLGLKCEVYDNLDEMLKRSDLHIVSICTPHNLHVPNLVKIAEAGKHALIEKPLALSVEELKTAYEVVKRTKIKTLVGFEARWNPFIRMMRNLVDDGTLGDLVYLEFGYFSEQGPWWPGFSWGITKESGGTVISVAACHAVDLLLYFGGDVDEVFAYHTRRNRQDYEYQPTIAGVLKFKNGIVGSLSSSFEVHAPYVFPIVIGGSKGSIRDGKLHTDRFMGQTDWIDIPTVKLDTPDVTHHPFNDEINHFVECILEDRESPQSVFNAGRSVEAGLALDISAETGKPVRLPII
jgi:predicted dehydrogenase